MSARARRMAELKNDGKSVAEIAQIYGVSTRTVQRALAKLKIKNQKSRVNLVASAENM
jgi:DNA-binding CsgD family transcriptional regulator